MGIAKKAVGLMILILIGTGVCSAGAYTDSKKLSENPFALTISGGISLGVYEAGLNWVIVETLRDNFSKDGRFRLDAVTGASAGAINTLLSVIRFCELKGPENDSDVNNNLFKDTWVNIDIMDLLPGQDGKYKPLELELGGNGKRDLNDALFSREPFRKVLADLSRRVVEGKDKNGRKIAYRDKLKVKLGLMVTRSKPLEASIETTMGPQKINSQRFVIPLIAETKKITRNGRPVVGLFFKNNTDYKPDNGKSMEYLFLPESDGYVGFDQVIRAALASSAFPFAFGRVNLEYCRPVTGATASAGSSSDPCPGNARHSSGYFIDGGTFDNVPLGVAVELIEQTAQTPIHANYIYMDPAFRRSVKSESKQDKEDEGSLVLADQIMTWTPAFGTLMSGELYRTLIAKFDSTKKDNRHRTLLLTRRYPPLAGNFMGHFGAFFDQSFRNYDYAVGVYDGLMNVTDYLYLLENPGADHGSSVDPDIASAKKAKLFKSLVVDYLDLKNDKSIPWLVGAFLSAEKKSPTWNEVKNMFRGLERAKDKGEHVIFDAIQKTGDSDFDGFLKEIAKNKQLFTTQDKNRKSQLQIMLENPDYWKISLAKRAIDRLLTLEEDGKGSLKLPLKVASVFANSKKIKNNNAVWSLSSVSDKKWWYWYVPDGIAMDGAQTGITLSYLAAPDWASWKWVYLEGDGTAHLQIKEVAEEQAHFGSLGVSLRHSFESAGISSVGVGLNVNRNFLNSDMHGQNYLLGGEVNIGVLADRLRISFGTRDLSGSYDGESLSLRFGFTDLDAWFSLL